MNAVEIAQLAYNAGWRGQDLIEAIANAGIESSFDPNAQSPTGCCGLWQLCPCVTTDPQGNANAAYAKWKAAGNSFEPDWTRYNGGSSNPNWNRFYSQAVDAVAQIGQSTSTSTSGGSSLPTPISLNPFDSLGNVIQSLSKDFEKTGTRILLTFLGVLVATVGIVLLVFGSFSNAADTAETVVEKGGEVAAVA